MSQAVTVFVFHSAGCSRFLFAYFYFRQYRTKIVLQMRRQIFRQMKQKAE